MRISDWSSDVCSSDLALFRQTGMALLLEPAFFVGEAAFLIDRGGEAVMEAAHLAAPIVRTRSGLVSVVAAGQRLCVCDAGYEVVVLVVTQLLGADRRETGKQHQHVGRRQLHHLERQSTRLNSRH